MISLQLHGKNGFTEIDLKLCLNHQNNSTEHSNNFARMLKIFTT